MRRFVKNDIVVVISGDYKGKTGKVLSVNYKTGKAIVEGINLVKKHLRKSQEHPQGAIIEKEQPIWMDKLMPYCENCKKGVRVRFSGKGKSKIRICAKCGKEL